MNQRKAELVLAAVERKYAKWLAFDNAKGTENGPKLVKNGPGMYVSYSIVWEVNSPDEWALKWGSEKNEDPAGVFCEPILSFVLGVYDA
jgi:hypothetical protein